MADAADLSTRSSPLVVLTRPSSPSSNGRPRTTSAFSHITQVPPAECVTTCATLADVLVTSPITLHNNNNNTTSSSHSGSHAAVAAGANLRAASTSNSKDNVTQASPTLSSSAMSATQAPHNESDKAAQPPITHSSSRRQGSTATGTNTSSSVAAMTNANALNDTLSSLSVTRSADPLSATQSPCEAALPAGAEERAKRTTRASTAEQPIPVSRQGSNEACATRAAPEEKEKAEEDGAKRAEGQSGYDAADMHTPLPFPDFTPPVSPTAQSSEALPEAAKAAGEAAAKDADALPAIESHAATAAVGKAKARSGLPSHNDTPRTAVLQANTPPPPGVAANTKSSNARTLSEMKNNTNAPESARHTPVPLRPPVQITHAADAAVPLPCFMQNASTVMPSSTSCNGLTWWNSNTSNSNNNSNNSNNNNNNPLFASFAHMNASGSSTALDEVQWSLRLMKSVNDNHAATTDDCMSDQLYRLLRAPPSCTLGNTDDFRVFFHTLMTVYRHDDLLPWETVVWLLRPGDQIRYKSMFAPMQCIDLDDFLRFVELASVRLRRI